MHKSSATKISLGDAGLVIAICFGWFIALSIEAVVLGFPSSASFSDASLMSIVALECAFASAALMLLHYRGYALATLLPTPSWRGSIVGALLYVGTLGIWSVAALALFNDENSTQPIAKILANATPSLLVVVLLSMVNGLYEEAFLLGYLLRGLTPYGASFALGTSMLVRVLYHLYQGPVGTVSVLIFGLVVSIYYYRTRALWPTVVAHALGDFVALT